MIFKTNDKLSRNEVKMKPTAHQVRSWLYMNGWRVLDDVRKYIRSGYVVEHTTSENEDYFELIKQAAFALKVTAEEVQSQMLRMPNGFTTHVRMCARCSGDHDSLEFKPLKNHDVYGYFAMCPEVDQPIMLRVLKSAEVPQ